MIGPDNFDIMVAREVPMKDGVGGKHSNLLEIVRDGSVVVDKMLALIIHGDVVVVDVKK